MSADKQLIAKGAEVVAGHVFLKRKLVGIYGPTGFIVTPEGEQALAIEDVEFKEVPAAPARKSAAKKAAPVDGNDDLLKGLDDIA